MRFMPDHTRLTTAAGKRRGHVALDLLTLILVGGIA